MIGGGIVLAMIFFLLGVILNIHAYIHAQEMTSASLKIEMIIRLVLCKEAGANP